MLAQVTVLVQLRLLVASNSGTTDVRLESCRYKCNVRAFHNRCHFLLLPNCRFIWQCIMNMVLDCLTIDFWTDAC